MDWLFKALLTAMMVWLVMGVARRCGHRWAGVAAALPTITAPTLAWLLHERGEGFALHAAVASVSASAMLASFSLAYAWAARRNGVGPAVGCGLVGGLAMAWPAFAASDCLSHALMLSLACSALAAVLIPGRRRDRAVRRRRPHALAGAALAAGGVTALAATLAPLLGSFATGLLASLPVISGAVVMVEHASGGYPAAANFLNGYVWGLFGKAAFGAVFVLLTPCTGAPVALALACGCAGLMSLLRVPPQPIDAALRSRFRELSGTGRWNGRSDAVDRARARR